MADNFYRALTKLVETNGGKLMRLAKGSHEIWQKGNHSQSVSESPSGKWHFEVARH